MVSVSGVSIIAVCDLFCQSTKGTAISTDLFLTGCLTQPVEVPACLFLSAFQAVPDSGCSPYCTAPLCLLVHSSSNKSPQLWSVRGPLLGGIAGVVRGLKVVVCCSTPSVRGSSSFSPIWRSILKVKSQFS